MRALTWFLFSPVAELQHVASSYGFPPVKVTTLRNELQVMNIHPGASHDHTSLQGLYTGVVELPGLGVYRGTPCTDEYMAKCSAAAVALAMLVSPTHLF